MKYIIQYYSNINYYINQYPEIKQFLNENNIHIKNCIKNNQIQNTNFIYSIIFLSIFNNYKNIYNKKNNTALIPPKIYNLLLIFDIIKVFIDHYNSQININNINNIVLYQIITQYNLFINENIDTKQNLNILTLTNDIINTIKDINNNILKCYNEPYQKLNKLSKNIINKSLTLNVSPMDISNNINNKLSINQEINYVDTTYLILTKLLFKTFNNINNQIFNNQFILSENQIVECSKIFSYYIKLITDFYNFPLNIIYDKNISFNYLINFGFTYTYKEYQETKTKLIKIFNEYNLYTYTIEHIINSIDSYIETFLNNSIMSDSS